MDNAKIKQLLDKRIEELRTARGLTQQQVADKMNIDQRTFSRIEGGKNFPLKTLGSLAEALDVDLTQLFDFNHLDLSAHDMREFIKSEIDNIPDEHAIIIFRFITAMYK